MTTVEAKQIFTEIGSFRADHLGDPIIYPVSFDHDSKREDKFQKHLKYESCFFPPDKYVKEPWNCLSYPVRGMDL